LNGDTPWKAQPISPPAENPPVQTENQARAPESILQSELKRVFGVDLTQFPGIRTGIAQTLVGEFGPDFTIFRSMSAFASWMGLCPDNDITGAKGYGWVHAR
jgi:transposase